MNRDDESRNPSDRSNIRKAPSVESLVRINVDIDAEESSSIPLEVSICDSESDDLSSNGPGEQGNGNDRTNPVEIRNDGSKTFDSSGSSNNEKDSLSPDDLKEGQNSDPRLARSTSLKSPESIAKIPNKKMVRFADALGLDLTDVLYFSKDGVPNTSQSACADLKTSNICSARPNFPSRPTDHRKFVPKFQQPGANPHFFDRVQQQKVCLENTLINGLRVRGVIRVLNLSFEKLVQVRYTTDNWESVNEITADYVPSKSSDRSSDRFDFDLNMCSVQVGETFIFVIKYVVNGQEFWDNNYGNNYELECVIEYS